MKDRSLRNGSSHGIASSRAAKFIVGGLMLLCGAASYAAECARELTANIVAIDMPLMFNRLGAQNINGMMYALERDIVTIPGNIPLPQHLTDAAGAPLEGEALDAALQALTTGASPGVALRPDKRPRPLVLRMGAGDCMTINLKNLLHDPANPFSQADADNGTVVRSGVPFRVHNDNQVAARRISLRFQGTQLVNGISDDGTWVGENATSDDALIAPGDSTSYKIHAPEDGAFLGVSYGGVVGGEGLGGTTASGLFAVLNVNAPGAAFYRSSVTNEELELAVAVDGDDNPIYTPNGQPVIDYEALYPDEEPWLSEGKAGIPVLNMVQNGELVHTAIDAVIAYGGADFEMEAPGDGAYSNYLGHFPAASYPLESVGQRNPTVPNRLEPFREFTVVFHDEVQTTQAFPLWYTDPVLKHTLHGVRDAFMINYGSGGIGSEILANRLGVGAMHDCVNCAYEEFFLTFHAVGEVGQLVDIPANAGLEGCSPNDLAGTCGAVGPKANYVLFPEDPSNVHHSYVGDAAAFRNLHAGPGEQHVFHLHNHQWLFNADDDNSNYLDAQGLGPGSGYAYWVNFGGSGNRNKTAGDAIFHCHFYPHFAQGMWEMWRIHDAFEPGTELVAQQASVDDDADSIADRRASFVDNGLGLGNGTPAEGARALPDGEIIAGAPTPAVIPLPGKAMPPMPAAGVTVKDNPFTMNACADASGNRVPRQPDTTCPVGSTEEQMPIGSLTDVDRDLAGGVYGPDGWFGPNPYNDYEDDGELNPGYPFWIASMEHTVGNRPPAPPLDMITNAQAQALKNSGDDLWQHPGWGVGESNATAIDGWDGGLPRFTVSGLAAGGQSLVALTRLDMSKEVLRARPTFYPEEGTDLEQIAMAYHSMRCHPSYRIEMNGTYESADCVYEHNGFVTNGSLPIAGAPYQDPCIDDRGELMDSSSNGRFFSGELAPIWEQSAMNVEGASPYDSDSPRVYKAANVQFDAVLNKLGYHFPQQRIITLWQDVVPTIKQERPPEPFVMRLNTFDCAQYVHSNVVPKSYELDDYQVRTPTDIIGQHIHLPKWDLTASDGSANGWNYEDGTLSPEAVVEIIEAINRWNDNAATPVTQVVNAVSRDEWGNVSVGPRPVVTSDSHELTAEDFHLHPSDHPFFGQAENTGEFAERWAGARSTMQRWFADPVVNVQGVDRGLGIIFTHDHYGPSTHQQVGLYATLLIQPTGSKWAHNETGTDLYTRTAENGVAVPLADGGPTSWQAAILTGEDGRYSGNTLYNEIESYREFYLEYTDFQHAYQFDVDVGMTYDESGLWTPTEGFYLHDAEGNSLAEEIFASALPVTPVHPGNRLIPAAFTRTGQPERETWRDAIQPPIRKQASDTLTGFPVDIWEFPPICPGGVGRPCAEAITADDPGMYVVNYRNESLAARIYDPGATGPDSRNGSQAAGRAGDLAFAMSSTVNRSIPELNDMIGNAPTTYFDGVCSNGVFCPPINDPDGLDDRDPFTPMARVFYGDNVKVKIQAGGQEEEHGPTISGLKWLQAGSGFGESKNSGWRNAQSAGISEQFSLRMPVFADYNQRGNEADHAYSINPSLDGWVNGTWGLLRSYKPGTEPSLYSLPEELPETIDIANASNFNGVCPTGAPVREYDITAVSVNDVLGKPASVTIDDLFPGSHVGAVPSDFGGTLVYNPRESVVASFIDEETDLEVGGGMGPLHDPTGIIYVMTEDLVALRPGYSGNGANKIPDDPYCWEMNRKGRWSYEPTLATCEVTLAPGVPLEPVVIRANAGDCIEVTLRNKVLQAAYEDTNGNEVYDYGVDYLLFAYHAKSGKYVAVVEDPSALLPGESELEPPFYADTDHNGLIEYDGATMYGAELLDRSPLGDVYYDETMDLANGNAIAGAVRRERGAGTGAADPGMTTFNNNLMQPSAHVGMHPQLVEYDITRADGMNVGGNSGNQTAAPGETASYRWYAGHLDIRKGRGRRYEIVATPVEFGGFNIMPADPIEQGQKGLVAAGVIYPQGSTWDVDPGRSTAATVTAPVDPAYPDPDGPTYQFRDFTTIASKGVSMYYADSYPIENILGEGTFGVAEDAQDMGHMNINFGNEAMWFRFGINPTAVDGNANCNGGSPSDCLGGLQSDLAALAFSNHLGVDGTATGTAIGDPETAVFPVTAGQEFRMHVLMPFGPGRGSTYDLHGHVWQRDPYVCPGDWDTGLEGKCDLGDGLPTSGSVGSLNLGKNPAGMYLGGIESWFPSEHYEIFIPEAGGAFHDQIIDADGSSDFLFRDHMGLGNTGGLWGIVRIQQPEE